MYVPVLKGRAGEFGALQTLPDHVRAELSPVLEVPPVPWDYTLDEPAKSLDAHLSAVVPKISKCWGNNLAWLDLIWISADDRLEDALLHGPEQIADLPVPVAESPGAVRIGHPERSHLVEYLAPNSVFNSLPRQRSSPHLRPDDRLVTIDRVLHHASLGVA